MANRKQESIEERVWRFIQTNSLLARRQKVVVAVSGGADSVCLLHVLASLRKEMVISLHVTHLDHQLRGEESVGDAQYVAGLAHQLKIPATIEQRDVKAYRAQRHLSLEEAAREVRYGFLAEIARKTGTERVAVGHTRDDHIETILMHLVRGSGIKGLCGLQPLTTGQFSGQPLTIVRPLLEISRQETAEYCRQHGLAPRVDASNLSLSPLRNRVRLQLLPQLATYNPRVTDALVRTARLAADEVAFLDGEVRRRWGKIEVQDDTVILDKSRFQRLPLALRRELLRVAMEALLGNLKDIEARHIEAMIEAAEKPAGKRVALPEGLHFFVEYERYLIGREAAALSPLPTLDGTVTLNVPGLTQLPGWKVEASIGDGHQAINSEDRFTAYLDFDRTGEKLIVRRRQEGDRFQPMGMAQLKKLGQFLIDARVPRTWRERIPIVTCDDRVAWVVGWRIDDRVKVTESTRHVLSLRFTRKNSD